MGRVSEKSRSEKIRDGESQKKEDAGAPKGRKVAIPCVFPMIWGSGGSKSNLAKAAGAEPAGQMRDEKVHAVVARTTFPSQKCQKPKASDHFWKLRCRKSVRHCGANFPSQNAQNTPTSDHFWKLRCGKSAHRCGAKHISKSKCTKHANVGPLLEVEMTKRGCSANHISKSKCTKHANVGPLLEVEMWKKCTPLWREAHFQVKMHKARQRRTTFGS